MGNGCTSFEPSVVAGSRFVHSTVVQPSSELADPLHIYIAGDGRPFLRPDAVAADPSIRAPLALALMRKDPGSLLLGRPCYHGRSHDPHCDFRKWTLERYGPEIVESMVVHARALLGSRQAVLVGHSGGGTLAVLMAERMADSVVTVITVAANLDVAGWASHHDFTPLAGSLDPYQRGALGPQIKQVHFVGLQDSQVPVYLARQYVSGRNDARLCAVRNATHTTGWLEDWPALLKAALRGDCPRVVP